MNITATPARTKGTRTIRTSIEGGTIPAASDGESPLSRPCRGAARALPAAVGGKDGAERREAVVVGGALLVVDHQEPLGTGPDRVGNVPDRLADVLLRDVLLLVSGPLRLMGED